MGRWSGLRALSAYKRPESHLTHKTVHGGIVTVLGALLAIVLASHETAWYLSGRASSKMAVDVTRRHDLAIHLDVSFPAIPCAGLSVDVLDASGSALSDASRSRDASLHKIRLDASGQRLGGKGSKGGKGGKGGKSGGSRRRAGRGEEAQREAAPEGEEEQQEQEQEGGEQGEYLTPESQRRVSVDAAGTVMEVDLGAAMRQAADMGAELQRHEGCRVRGEFAVRRVAGKVHFAVHQQSFVDVLPQMLTGNVLPRLTNMSHVIHKVAFGPEFPGQLNPLDGIARVQGPDDPPRAYKYFLKIVPTEYRARPGARVLETSQYSVSEYAPTLIPSPSSSSPLGGVGGGHGSSHHAAAHQAPPPPGADTHAQSTVRDAFVDLSYDLSPIVMTIHQSPATLLHFLVRLCAVVGGVLSVTRMADKAVHAALVAAGVARPPPGSASLSVAHKGGGGVGGRLSSGAGGLIGTTSLGGAGANGSGLYARPHHHPRGSYAGSYAGSHAGSLASPGGSGNFAGVLDGGGMGSGMLLEGAGPSFADGFGSGGGGGGAGGSSGDGARGFTSGHVLGDASARLRSPPQQQGRASFPGSHPLSRLNSGTSTVVFSGGGAGPAGGTSILIGPGGGDGGGGGGGRHSMPGGLPTLSADSRTISLPSWVSGGGGGGGMGAPPLPSSQWASGGSGPPSDGGLYPQASWGSGLRSSGGGGFGPQLGSGGGGLPAVGGGVARTISAAAALSSGGGGGGGGPGPTRFGSSAGGGGGGSPLSTSSAGGGGGGGGGLRVGPPLAVPFRGGGSSSGAGGGSSAPLPPGLAASARTVSAGAQLSAMHASGGGGGGQHLSVPNTRHATPSPPSSSAGKRE